MGGAVAVDGQLHRGAVADVHGLDYQLRGAHGELEVRRGLKWHGLHEDGGIRVGDAVNRYAAELVPYHAGIPGPQLIHRHHRVGDVVGHAHDWAEVGDEGAGDAVDAAVGAYRKPRGQAGGRLNRFERGPARGQGDILVGGD